MKRLALLPLLLLAVPASAEEIGECQFNRETLTFAGSRVEQATCLLRKIELLAVRKPQPLPKVIRSLMERAGGPSADQQSAALAAFPEPYRTFAAQWAETPLSRTDEGLPALYFVIHDTSTPFYENDPFPKRLDWDLKVNDFTPYMNGTFAREPVAHIFLNRVGQIWAHGASSHWLQSTGKKWRLVFGYVPLSTCLTQQRQTPSGIWCSDLHATVQAWQPMQARLSMAKPSRGTAVSAWGSAGGCHAGGAYRAAAGGSIGPRAHGRPTHHDTSVVSQN